MWCRLSDLLIFLITGKHIFFSSFLQLTSILVSFPLSYILRVGENELIQGIQGCVNYLKPWFSLTSRVCISFPFRLSSIHCESSKLDYSHLLYVFLFTIPLRNYFYYLSIRRRKIQGYNFNLFLQSLTIVLNIVSMLLTEHYFFLEY